jgi:twitching motility two-component system response regulator PilH
VSLTILIVDDARADRRHLERILLDAGHRVLVAGSGEEGVAHARSGRPDLILVDVGMPDLVGFAATRRLKGDAATRDIPLVFVTGKNAKADRAWGRMLGARGCVGKPYRAEEILGQLQA